MPDDSFNAIPKPGGGNFTPFAPNRDNPMAGIRKDRDSGEFGGSKMFIPEGFQTRASKANDVNWDDEDDMGFGGGSKLRNKSDLPPDESAPF
jgi:hypothetical protein